MKRINKLLMLIIGIFVLSACGTGKDNSDESNDLVVYSPNSEGIINAVIPRFEEETGIKVELVSAGTGELMKRIESEKSNPYADVLFGGGYTQYIPNKDLFEEYVSTENENLIDEYKNTEKYVTYNVLDGSVLVVNTELAEELGVKIESYSDLLDPKLKGKISTADPANSSSAFAQLTNILLAMSDDGTYESEAAWDYVEELVELWDGKIQSSSSSVYKSVADGEMVVGLSYEDPVVTLIESGADNVEIVYPEEGTVFLPAGAGIVKDSKNMDNAKKFIDFILSKEIQDVFGTELTNRPVREDAEIGDHLEPIDNIHLIFEDMDYVEKHQEEIVERYMDIYTEKQ